MGSLSPAGEIGEVRIFEFDNQGLLANHSLLVRDGRIAAILPTGEAEVWLSASHVRLPGHALMPGLVNLHTHAAMSLLRRGSQPIPVRHYGLHYQLCLLTVVISGLGAMWSTDCTPTLCLSRSTAAG